MLENIRHVSGGEECNPGGQIAHGDDHKRLPDLACEVVLVLAQQDAARR
ncbi:MAG: hypothetical protein WCK58_13915 [Chloroflexota bacterium]